MNKTQLHSIPKINPVGGAKERGKNKLSTTLCYLVAQTDKESSVLLCKTSFSEEGLVDGAGFEPAASTMPTRLHLDSDCLKKLADFLLVNMRLEKKTIQQNIQDARRFLEMSDYIVNYENVRRYLKVIFPKQPKPITLKLLVYGALFGTFYSLRNLL